MNYICTRYWTWTLSMRLSTPVTSILLTPICFCQRVASWFQNVLLVMVIKWKASKRHLHLLQSQRLRLGSYSIQVMVRRVLHCLVIPLEPRHIPEVSNLLATRTNYNMGH